MTPPGSTRSLRVPIATGLVATGAAAAGLALTGTEAGAEEWLMGTEALVASIAAVAVLRARPGHPIGKLLVAYAVFNGLTEFTTGYVDWAYAAEPVRSGGLAARVVREFGWPPLFAILGGLLLRFPTGQPLTFRWARMERAMWAWLLVVSMLSVIPRQFSDHPRVNGMTNPLGISGLDGLEWLSIPVTLLLLFMVLAAAASVFVRFHRSSGEQRQQLKWFMFLSSPMLLLVIAVPAWSKSELARATLGIVTMLLLAGIVVPILRYRLYDIDLVIRRTVAWALVTGLLTAVYVTMVAGLAPAIEPDGATSDLTIAAATLVIVSLFNPLRRRVQATVDRRFNRARFDIERAAADFGGRLRNQVALHTLTDELTSTVGATIQPQHIALWLRSPGTGREAPMTRPIRNQR